MKTQSCLLKLLLLFLTLLVWPRSAHAYYDPNVQRWVNRDPLNEFGGVNLHIFVGNAPSYRADSDGRQIVILAPPVTAPPQILIPPLTSPTFPPPIILLPPNPIPGPTPTPVPAPVPSPGTPTVNKNLPPCKVETKDDCQFLIQTSGRCYYSCTYDDGTTVVIWVPRPDVNRPCPKTPPMFPGPSTPAPQTHPPRVPPSA